MQTARQIAYRYGPRFLSKTGKYLYRRYRKYKYGKLARKNIRLYYKAQNVVANILINKIQTLDFDTDFQDTNPIMFFSSKLNIADLLVTSNSHHRYASMYDEYKVAIYQLSIIPMGYHNMGGAQVQPMGTSILYGLVDNTGENATTLPNAFSLNDPSTRFVTFSSSTPSYLQFSVAPTTMEQKDDWQSCVADDMSFPKQTTFNPKLIIVAELDGSTDGATVVGSGGKLKVNIRLSVKLYYRKPRLNYVNVTKNSLPEQLCQVIQPTSTEIFKQQDNVQENNTNQ